MIVITSRLTAMPGGRDALIIAFEQLHAAVADEPGTLVFAMHEAGEDELFFYEVYRDEAALAAHRDSPAVRDLAGHLDGLLDGPPVITYLTPLRTKGL